MNLNLSHLIAEQSLFAQLVIKKRKPIVTEAQEKSTKQYISYNDNVKLTDVDVDEYSIINLPATIKTLPINSIYDRIMHVRDNLPDFRFIRIDSSESDKNPISTQKTKVMNESMKDILLNGKKKESVNLKSIFKPAPTVSPKIKSETDRDSSPSSVEEDNDL